MARKISPEYLAIQQKLHADHESYGSASTFFAPTVAEKMRRYSLNTISDYGAGKKRLLRSLADLGSAPSEYYPYDPAFPEYGKPMPASLVCCIDVLEHIEPNKLNSVLDDLASITSHFGFFSVHMGPAGKVLSDGRNAHLIQKPTSWWLTRIVRRFEVIELQPCWSGHGFWVFVKPRDTSQDMKSKVIKLIYPNYKAN